MKCSFLLNIDQREAKKIQRLNRPANIALPNVPFAPPNVTLGPPNVSLAPQVLRQPILNSPGLERNMVEITLTPGTSGSVHAGASPNTAGASNTGAKSRGLNTKKQ